MRYLNNWDPQTKNLLPKVKRSEHASTTRSLRSPHLREKAHKRYALVDVGQQKKKSRDSGRIRTCAAEAI
jgi:hypothetical protein